MCELAGHVRRQFEHVFEPAPDHRERGMTGDRLGGTIEREYSSLPIGCCQAARQAVDDVLVERLEVGDLARRAFETGTCTLQAIGERPAEKRDREKQKNVESRRV